MKRILVSMLQEHGHLNPSFKVNRTLRARGHDVRYLGILDFEEYIGSQGFEMIPFLPDLYPRGFIQEHDKLGTLAARRAITRRFEEVTERLLDPRGVRELFTRLAPDLMIIDINHTTIQLLAWQMGIPFIAMNVTLPQTKDAGVPPLRTGGKWRPGIRGLVEAELAWKKFEAKRKVLAFAADRAGMCPQYELARRVAPRFGLPADLLDVETVYMPRIAGTPELILCPEAFDFPRPPLAGRHYVESVDLDRTEGAFPWERLDEKKPLVYVSMGSQRFQPKHVRRFLENAVAALGRRPEWQVVVALGRHLAPEELTSCPPNVVAVKSAPQLALLRRASAMVTHGGLGSVKECVVFGVPMVVFPLAVDQPDNAARVEHHRIGRAGDIREVSQAGLLQMLDEVMHDPGYRARAKTLAERFEATERGTRGADVVEALLASGPARNASFHQ